MSKVYIREESNCIKSVTDPGNGGEWDSYTESAYDYSLSSAVRVVEGQEPENRWILGSEYEVHGEWPNKDEVYAVVVRYSDGSTFGRSTGHGSIQAVLGTAKEAEALAAAIVPDVRPNNNGYYGYRGITWESCREALAAATGHKIGKDFYLCWTGYFSSLEDVEVHRLFVRDSTDFKEHQSNPKIKRKGY